MTHLLDIKPRHDFISRDDGVSHYGPWRIAPADWIRPSPAFDWDWWHEDFDGAEDAGDHRCGSAASLPDCVQAIHDWEDEQ